MRHVSSHLDYLDASLSVSCPCTFLPVSTHGMDVHMGTSLTAHPFRGTHNNRSHGASRDSHATRTLTGHKPRLSNRSGRAGARNPLHGRALDYRSSPSTQTARDPPTGHMCVPRCSASTPPGATPAGRSGLSLSNSSLRSRRTPGPRRLKISASDGCS